MKPVSALVLGVLVLASAGSLAAQDDNAKKIVGKWELTKSDSELPTGSTAEFTKDGKLTAVIAGDNMKIEGTYTIEKDKLTVTLKVNDQKVTETVTVLKLNDKELELKDKDGKIDTFKKK